jgi:hypothetical protein
VATTEGASTQAGGYLRFQTNIPEEVALRYAEGKQVKSQNKAPDGTPWPDQLMFSLVDGRVMYVPLHVGEIIRELGIGPGERISIGKFEVKQGNRRGTQIQIKRVDPPAEKPAAPAAPQAAKLEGAAARPGTPVRTGTPTQSTANGNGNGTAPVNGKPPVNGNGNAAAIPTKVQFGDAMQEFLVLAGRATKGAEVTLGAEGGSVRFDSRDIAATATTMFIEAARNGWLTWRPGGVR